MHFYSCLQLNYDAGSRPFIRKKQLHSIYGTVNECSVHQIEVYV